MEQNTPVGAAGQGPASIVERYAEFIVRMGANVQPGQDVHVHAHVEHVVLARAVAEHAYRAGARRVVVDYADLHVWRSAIQHAPFDALGELYSHELERFRMWRDRGVAYIALFQDPDPRLFDGLDPMRVSAQWNAWREEITVGEDPARGASCCVGAPNEAWARQVFGEPDLDRLWAAVAVATRLDQPDPFAAWRSHLATLKARADALQALSLDALRFRGPGTDLTVGLIPGAAWLAGSWRTKAGVEFLFNVPTEEVFTSPDWRRTEGTVRATEPELHGLRLRFANGRIVEVDADEGAERWRAEIDSDDRARYLGEVALVEGSTSPVRRAGVAFHHGIFNENAACHIAYGAGFPHVLPGLADLGPEQQMSAGVNVSRVHFDIPMGGPEVDVDGVHIDGTVTPIMRGDAWALPVGEGHSR